MLNWNAVFGIGTDFLHRYGRRVCALDQPESDAPSLVVEEERLNFTEDKKVKEKSESEANGDN